MSRFSVGILYAVICGLCWAVLAIGLKYALGFASTGNVAWLRMSIAFAILFIAFAFNSKQSLKKIFLSTPKSILIAGLFLSFNYYGYMTGLELTSASNAQIMIQTGPLALLFAGIFYFKEQMRFIQWIGVFIAGLGFLLFNWDQLIVSAGHQDVYLIGNVWIVTAALAWTIFAALQKIQLGKNWTPQMINLVIYGICSVALLPTANLSELAPLNLHQWLVLFALGLNTVIAYGAFGEAMQRIPASYVSLIITLNPLVTILIMTVLTETGLNFVSHEPIFWRGYLGAFLVVVGVGTAVSLKPKKILQT